MRASELASKSEVKKSEIQHGETASSTASRPSVSASGSRGAFSCRRWRLLSGKPSKDDDTLDSTTSIHKPSLVAAGNVQRPTTANVDSKDWASTATPFAAFLPRDTIIPTISRKSVAAVVLTSECPPENVKKWDREMTICERKHIKVMGRMATRIYRGRGVGEDPSEPSRRQKNREKQALKDQIYLPVLCHARAGGSRDLIPRASKSVQSSPQRDISSQDTENAIELPSALAGMKLLSSQLDELRAGLDAPSSQPEQRATVTAYARPRQTSRICRIGPPDTGSSSSSLETLLLRVLERPPACPDGYQADQEASTVDSSDGVKTKSLDSRSTNPSEDDLLFLLNALDSTSQASSQDDFSTLVSSVRTSELTTSEGPNKESQVSRMQDEASSPVRSMQRPNNEQLIMSRNRKQKPASAYQYYQKLVQDFDSIEREMESHQEEQSELEARLERAQAKIRASKAEDELLQQTQWERERDRQLEKFIQQRSTLDTLRAQTEALEAQELRLQAEMEVLRERQQETSETEARQIRRLVHERTTLLEDELAKGKLDLDYIAQVVSCARHQELKQKTQRDTNQNAMSSVKNLVKDVQERRQRDFETAEANFQARMRSFQLEKEVLAKKAKDLRVTKQRALQILSQNQQQVIKGFFDTSSASQNREEKVPIPPTIDFGEILQSLNQSGAQVEHIQTIDSERNSGCRELTDALQQARAILENGNQRVEAIQKSLLHRKAEAQRLGITVDSSETTRYDGAWGIEAYAPRQFETVYFVRSLVFSCMDAAITEVSTQPPKELLEFEVKRWSDTHASVEYDRNRERTLEIARQTLANLMDEVIAEAAKDLRLEFESSAHCVRGAVTNAIRSVLFPTKLESPETKKTINKSQTAATASASLPALRPLLFESSFDHLRTHRNRRNDSSSTTILHRAVLPVSHRYTTKIVFSPPSATKSPAKKTFSLFSSSNGTEKLSKTEVLTETTTAVLKPSEPEDIPFISTGLPSSPRPYTHPAIKFWENEPHLRSRSIIVPSSLGYPSCGQVSSQGDLLICGTTEGELISWDLLPDQPTILCTWSPPKAERSRIIRVVLSADSQVVLAFFRRRTVSVFVINAGSANTGKTKQATHSEDCFPVELSKVKPRNLEVLVQLSVADALDELPFTRELCEHAPNAVAKNSATVWSAADLCSGSFFATSSLTGIATCSTSILFGASTGDLLKFNLQPQRDRNGARLHSIQAAFDSPSPENNGALNTKSIRREFFRGHRRAVLFASCLHRESDVPEVLSVDQDGIVCLWKYVAEEFTGFGWFKPTLRTRLELSSDLATSVSNASNQLPDKSPGVFNGEVLQVGLTPDDSRLVFMVFYGDPTKKETTGTLRFFQLLTISMQLDRVQLDVDFVGGNGAPRFAVTTNFLFLLANNRVRVYALRTGKEAREPIALSASGKQQLTFNSISCTTTSNFSVTDNLGSPTKLTSKGNTESTTMTLVVSGDQHSRVTVISFTSSTPQKSTKPNNKRER